MYNKILSLSIPNIISNITIPLVGMVDLVVVGMLQSDVMLSGIAIGTAIFNMLYYALAFLRMGTSGVTAQAYGRKDFSQMSIVLMRGTALAFLLSLLILIFSPLIESASLWFMDASSQVEAAASSYFRIRIWAAPATLSLYVYQGWFIGMQNARTPMWVALIINVINIVLSYVFAITLSLGLDGVAYGTLIAQWAGVLVALFAVIRYYGKVFKRGKIGKHSIAEIIDREKLKAFFTLNSNILIRTLCLVMVFTYFTKASSSQGDTLLAANTILMQLFTLFSYFMDGFAYAGEALSGKYYGAGSQTMLSRAISCLFRIGALMAVVFSLGYFFFGANILTIFNPSEVVFTAASDYMLWAALVPLCGFAAFLWDGILVGMTLSSLLRNSMLGATIVFFVVYFSLSWLLGNIALWIAFLLFLSTRGVLQWIYTRKLLKKEIDLSGFWTKRIDVLKKTFRG